jgi:hypothetical protein
MKGVFDTAKRLLPFILLCLNLFGQSKKRIRKRRSKAMPTIQELKDQSAVIIDQAYAEGVTAGGAGGAIYTQEQLDQAVGAAVAAEQVAAAENLALVKQAIKSNLQNLNTQEAAAEQAAVDQA